MSTDDPATADFDKANVARIHDWLLGGTLHTPRDRAVGTAVLDRAPALRNLARHNRTFLRDAVHHMLDHGIRHFLDLGSGLPTMGAVHQLARARRIDATVVYVDNDPATVASGTLLLEHTLTARIVEADLRRPESLLARPEVHELRGRPLGLLAVDVLDTLPDRDRPDTVLLRYLDTLAADSIVALTHLVKWPAHLHTTDDDPLPQWAVKHPRDLRSVRSWISGLALLPTAPPEQAAPQPPDPAPSDPVRSSPDDEGDYEVAQLLMSAP